MYPKMLVMWWETRAKRRFSLFITECLKYRMPEKTVEILVPGIIRKILIAPVLSRSDIVFPVEAADVMAAGGKAQKGTDIGAADGTVFQHVAGGFTFFMQDILLQGISCFFFEKL